MFCGKEIQEIFYLKRDSEDVFYLINHREERYSEIPKEYNGLCMNLYCSGENKFLGIILSEKIKGYKLVDLDKVNG